MFQIAICEDQVIQAEHIKELVCAMMEEPVEVSVYYSADELLTALQQEKKDFQIILMDIELGKNSISGIELSHRINMEASETQIIYLTQYLDYVTDVYQTAHTAFVYKKNMEQNLGTALHLAMRKIREQEKQFLYVRSGVERLRILQKDILYFERILRDTILYCEDGTYRIKESFPELQKILNTNFECVHRSYMINLNCIRSMDRKQLVLKNGKEIPVGRTHYENLKKSYARFLLRES